MDHHVEYLGTLELLEWYVLMMIWLWSSDYLVTYELWFIGFIVPRYKHCGDSKQLQKGGFAEKQL